MITFENGIDYRSRTPAKPTVARFRVDHGYRYIVIGTEYGHLRNLAGDVRTWQSYSGAYRAARNYANIWA